jgi:pimeloyl-ACP methyl ester carboxylesterase
MLRIAAILLIGAASAQIGLAEQTASPEPRAFTTTERAFRSGDIPLFGTFLLPAAPGPHAGVVFIHGSGTSTRENRWYLQIAEDLAGEGIAVLLPDKRGSGKSGGSWETASFEDLAGDAAAGVAALREIAGVAIDRVGVLGVSQGAHVAPIVPNRVPDLAFVVTLSGSIVPLDEQLRFELGNTLRQEGWPRFMIPVVRPVAVRVVKRRLPRFWELNGAADPIFHWQRLRVPALAVFGAQDERDNVPVAKSVARLRALSPRPEGAPIDVVVYPDSGHGLYAPGTQTIRADLLAHLVVWIRAAVQR